MRNSLVNGLLKKLYKALSKKQLRKKNQELDTALIESEMKRRLFFLQELRIEAEDCDN